MRFLIAVIAIAVLSGLVTLMLPWWAVVVAAALVCALMRLRPAAAFRAGFAGVSVLWLAVGLIRSGRNAHLLAGRLAALFHLPHWSLYLLVAALVGGLAGGLGGWSGSVLRGAGARRL